MTFTQHPQRALLHNEIHARPPEALAAPLAISHIVMLADEAGRHASRAHLAELLNGLHQATPEDDASYLRGDLGPYTLRWERHTEFVSWTFIRPLTDGDVQALAQGAAPPCAIDVVSQGWLRALPGENLLSLHLWALPKGALNEMALEIGRASSRERV